MEVNRMLRSNTFNPSLRVKNTDTDGGELQRDQSRTTAAQYRRRVGKRPSHMDLTQQRSAAMVSILPLPKEAARLRAEKGEGTAKELSFEESQEQSSNSEDNHINPSVGIIGMPLKLFNLMTLAPLDDEHSADKQA